jgi:hypothetical protein
LLWTGTQTCRQISQQRLSVPLGFFCSILPDHSSNIERFSCEGHIRRTTPHNKILYTITRTCVSGCSERVTFSLIATLSSLWLWVGGYRHCQLFAPNSSPHVWSSARTHSHGRYWRQTECPTPPHTFCLFWATV